MTTVTEPKVAEPVKKTAKQKKNVEPVKKTALVKKTGKPAKQEKEGKRGAGAYFRALVLDRPDLDNEQLREKAAKAGYHVSKNWANLIRYETTATLKMLEERGWLSRKSTSGRKVS